MRIILMGTGTSHGMPVIACHCHACTSCDKRDKRLRCSAYICKKEPDGDVTRIVIDTGPEFRLQALKYEIPALNAVLLTHSHADHLHGLDDLRIFSHTATPCHTELSDPYPETNGRGLPIYANSDTIEDVRNRFDYIFKKTQAGGGKPKLALIDCAGYSGVTPLVIGGISVIPVPIRHGELPVSGWLMISTGTDGCRHSITYLTDCNYISPESIRIIRTYGGIIDHVVIDGLRERAHSTHCSFTEAMAFASQIGGTHTWFTHICHDMCHTEIIAYVQKQLPQYPVLDQIVKDGGSVGPAYDGLELTVGE